MLQKLIRMAKYFFSVRAVLKQFLNIIPIQT